MQHRLRHSGPLGYRIGGLGGASSFDPSSQILTNGTSTWRIDARDGSLNWDYTLTALGFDGVEDTDWYNAGSITHPMLQNFLFFGLYSDIVGGQMPNLVGNDYLTVAGVAGSETYQTPNTAAYIAADTDYIWFDGVGTQRTTTTAELIGYDFPRTLVKYGNTTPYNIGWIGILKLGTSVTDAMRDLFNLNIWWNNTLSFHGNTKQNKPLPQQYVWSPYDAASTALFTRMTAVSETPSAARKTVLDTAIVASKAAGIWDGLMDAQWLLASHGNDSALLNIIKASHNITLVNTPDFVVDRGYTGNGSDEALDCNYNPSTEASKFAQNANSIGIYIRTNVDELAHDFDCESSADHGNLFIPRLTNSKYIAINSTYQVSVNADSRGMWVFARDTALTFQIYKNGTWLDQAALASEALANETWSLLCRKLGAARDRYSTKQIALHFIGGVLDQTKVTAFQTIWVDGYLSQIGAKV
jgi:frataxin-like iron-binding protein CyaY